MREELRAAERMVGIFVASLYSTNKDAGWHQPSVFSRLIEYQGDLPAASGYDQADLKMISEIRWIKSNHPELHQAIKIMEQVELQQQLVLIVYTRLKGLVCPHTDSVWTIGQMAAAIGMAKDEFTKLKQKGFEKVIEVMA